jgi:spoIIIJ-associated protein
MDKVNTIKTEVELLLSKMIDNFSVEVSEEDGLFQVIIKTDEEAPTVIGRHGETIRALQKILEVMLYKKIGEPISLLVNVNDYREKQKERLERIASEMVSRVQTTKEPAYFRGLSSYERKLIHEYVTQNYPDITTYSVGEGRDRRLVIDVKKEETGTGEQEE